MKTAVFVIAIFDNFAAVSAEFPNTAIIVADIAAVRSSFWSSPAFEHAPEIKAILCLRANKLNRSSQTRGEPIIILYSVDI